MSLDVLNTEADLIEELRRRIKGKMKESLYEDDHFLTRFLRARNHNINAAETMLKNHIKWRNQHQVDTLLDEYVPPKFSATEYVTVSRLGKDMDGSYVTYFHFGHMDMKGLLKTVSHDEILLYVVHFLEQDLAAMKKEREKIGKLVEKCVFIFNFDGFSLTSATNKQVIELYINILTVYEANFPEILKRAYGINVSYYFFLVWAILKPFISEETHKKIRLIGKVGWQEELLELISPDVLPAFLGGNRTDPDGNPMCRNVIRFGGIIPESNYNYANQTCSARIPGAKRISVARMSKAEVTLHVNRPGLSLEWEFVVGSRDIGFSVIYRDEVGNEEVVIPKQRVETSTARETGMCLCQKRGTYVIEFDNSYSWLHGKEIYYTATIFDNA